MPAPAKMHCPDCGELGPCESLSATPAWHDDRASGKEVLGAVFKKGDPETKYYRRLRRCRGCDHEFITVEIPEKTFSSLKSDINAVKESASEYIKHAEAAVGVLKRFT